MKYGEIVTDMVVEAAEIAGLSELTQQTQLSHGIVRRQLYVKSLELASRINRERGMYITFDCPLELYRSSAAIKALVGYISKTLTSLLGNLRSTTPVLVLGLGNGGVVADALGKMCVDGVHVSRDVNQPIRRQCVCALSTGVLGTTGMQSAEVAAAVCAKIKPSHVIAIDSLATGTVGRLGTSFQLSTAGIAPGSGVGSDKERIDKSVLGVPTVAIGVPLMLAMNSAIYSFVKDFTSSLGDSVDEYRLRTELAQRKLSSLVVAPKDIDFLVENAALIIADAVNDALGV